jgi:hypothetical protein
MDVLCPIHADKGVIGHVWILVHVD